MFGIFLTWVICCIFFKEYYISLTYIHFLLAGYYIIILNYPQHIWLTHYAYTILIITWISSYAYNLNPLETLIGKKEYSYIKNQEEIYKDMVGRSIILERGNMLLENMSFNLLDGGPTRIDIFGLNDNINTTGYIILKGVTKLYGNINEGSCGPKEYEILESKFPECKKECENNSACNHIKWDINNNKCNLMTGCSSYDFFTNDNWKNRALEKLPRNHLKINEVMVVGNYIISENGKYLLQISLNKQLKLYNTSNRKGTTLINIKDKKKQNTTHAFNITEKGGIGLYNIDIYPIYLRPIKTDGEMRLILLNRGIVVIYNISTYNILWTNIGEEWKDSEKAEDILKKEIELEAKAPIEYRYDLRKKKVKKLTSIVEHKGTIKLYNNDNNNTSVKGDILIYTSKLNNNNYMKISNTNKFDGKYLIR